MLSVHALFESVLLGLQIDNTQAAAILLAILSHKWVESLSLGIIMIKTGVSQSGFSVIMVTFSAIAPLGVGIGVLAEGSVPHVVVTVFNALAMGSFVYIGTTEIISEEFSATPSLRIRILKFVFLLLGCVVIGVVRIWSQHEETNHHHHKLL